MRRGGRGGIGEVVGTHVVIELLRFWEKVGRVRRRAGRDGVPVGVISHGGGVRRLA